jgi:hypothetical protein
MSHKEWAKIKKINESRIKKSIKVINQTNLENDMKVFEKVAKRLKDWID